MVGQIIITRRSALLGAISSALLLPTARPALAAETMVEPLVGWEAVELHAFALQDALNTLAQPWWHVEVWGGRGVQDRLHALNPMRGTEGGGFRMLDRPAI